MKTYRGCLFLFLIASLWIMPVGWAGEPKVDPQAMKVLQQVAEYLRSLQGLKVSVTLTQRIRTDDEKNERSITCAFDGQRPNKLRLIVSGGMELSVLSDGQKAYTVLPSMRKYTTEEAQTDWSGVLAEDGVGNMMAGPGYQVLKDLLHQDVVKQMMNGVTNLQYIALEELAGAKCHRLRFAQEGSLLDAWFMDGPQPWLRQIVFDTSEVVARARAQRPELKNIEVALTLGFADWVANPEWKDGAFRFETPAGMELVSTFFADEPSPEHLKLLGQPAPNFKLAAIAGSDVELASHKDKNVVVLDFWATWCGPCRRGLPILNEVAGSLAHKGVVFYAVNRKETPDTIKTFLEKSGLKLPVLLDENGKVGGLYGVKGIPQTVLIGKDGTVQAVHVGVAPDLKKRLRRELDALVAGKGLVVGPSAGKAN